MAIIFPADAVVFRFFWASSPGVVLCFECSLVSGVHKWIHVSSRVTKRRRNSFGLRLNSLKHCSEVVSRTCLSWVGKCSTHRGDGFLVPKISCRIRPTRSFEMPTDSAISRTLSRRYANIMSWIFATLSAMVAVCRAPGQGSPKPTCDLVSTRTDFWWLPLKERTQRSRHRVAPWLGCAFSLPKTRIESPTDIGLFLLSNGHTKKVCFLKQPKQNHGPDSSRPLHVSF